MLKEETAGVRHKYQFDNLVDMVDYISSAPRVWDRQSSRATHDKQWTLGVSWEGALRMARNGWEEGIRQVHALAAAVPNNTVVTRELSVAGEYPDVPRYLAGDPFNMVKRGKARVPKPTMTIVSSIGANSHVSGQAMANFGAAIVALVDRLESRGVRVELIGCWRSTGMGDRSSFSMSWTVKRAEDALDLSAVAFGLGHPAMLRRLGFAVMERSPKRVEIYGYGASTSVIGPVDLIDVPDSALFIGGVGDSNRECATLEGAVAYAKRSINRAYRALGYDEDVAELEDYED
jgi:hypothetical protein